MNESELIGSEIFTHKSRRSTARKLLDTILDGIVVFGGALIIVYVFYWAAVLVHFGLQ